MVQLLSESYNPHVRYGAAMALGIACAGTGNKDALALIEPMKNDPVNYVRQVGTKPLKYTFYVYLGKVGSICTGKNRCRSCTKIVRKCTIHIVLPCSARIRIHLIRIRIWIQHFRLNEYRSGSNPDSGFR